MKLGLNIGYTAEQVGAALDGVLEAERLGFDSVWTSEAYGTDAVTPAAWLLARTHSIRVGTGIMQMPARTPTCAAMTAMTLDLLSGGRFIAGLGPSGPQVVEGWHGVAYGKPVTRTREYVAIMRAIFAREAPLTHAGEHYQIPYRGEGASGLGKPLKSIVQARPTIPIYTAATSPAGMRVAAEIADGVIPIWLNPSRHDVIAPSLAEGFARAGSGKDPGAFDVAPFVPVAMGEDLDVCRTRIKEHLALYIGGMGARGRNFYNDYACRLGYEAQAARIQDAFLSGRKPEAVAAVPDRLVDEVALVGPAAHVREQLEAWRDAARQRHVGTMIVSVFSGGAAALRTLAEALL
ncbi:MAG: LLM class F420-dependent oxidoreductase [Gammaproteobacteria bacterium]|nr:LLM class F420-dependent oxidoreductase [Gammaproteobacteria bacterium]